MACPAATGVIARLLAGLPDILKMHRDQARSDKLAQVALRAVRRLGFPPEFEGNGLPGPDTP
jgi:hypothetical protein